MTCGGRAYESGDVPRRGSGGGYRRALSKEAAAVGREIAPCPTAAVLRRKERPARDASAAFCAVCPTSAQQIFYR